MTTLSDAFEGEQPSFEDITLYKLCYWKVTRIYSCFDPRRNRDSDYKSRSSNSFSPSSWPGIIKAYLTGESIPTYLPGHLLPCHFGILPTYLPRDWFLPSELVVPLVNTWYHRDYHIWKRRLDANTRATDFLVDHLRDPLPTISQVIEAPVCIPCPYCQSCRTQVVERIFQHISQLRWPHTTWRSIPKLF
jgi:hypothetical protein